MTDDLMRQWGSNIALARKLRGLSVKTFAEEMGVSVATVSRWEAGKMAPRDDNKVEIATVLATDVRMLFPLVRAS